MYAETSPPRRGDLVVERGIAGATSVAGHIANVVAQSASQEWTVRLVNNEQVTVARFHWGSGIAIPPLSDAKWIKV